MTGSETAGRMVIVGAGQAGALLAIYLARHGHDVTMFESRPDLRNVDIDAGRSINLALATRGIVPLIDVGVIEQVDAITIPMRGRMVHATGDPMPDLLPYGSKSHEVIHSVSRTDLNAILLDAAEATGRVENITPRPLHERGCQYALQVVTATGNGLSGRHVFEALEEARVLCDWREPDVIRAAPVPLYNSFDEIARFVDILDGIVQ